LTKREFNGTNTKPAIAGLVFPFFHLLVVFITLLVVPCEAQWKQLIKRPGNFQFIYFLDLPGPPRIGFLGGFDSLFKTTDGGENWNPINNFPYSFAGASYIFDINFKDSTTGWAASGQGCYKTTDGGDNWFFLDTGMIISVYYDSSSGGLFLSTYGGAAPGWHGANELSWDEGTTWEPFAFVGNENSGGFAFSDGDNGLMAYGDDYSDYFWWRTTDGGHSWNSLPFDTQCWQPLAIQGTSTYFANTLWGNILRTDDAGDTWKTVHAFSSENLTGSWAFQCTSSSCIRGTLDSLYVMMPSGCYLSTDQGVNWKYLCGVPDIYWPLQHFYVKNKSLYVIGDDSSYTTLWMLNLDSLNTFSTSFSFPDDTKQVTIPVGNKVTVNFSPQTSDPLGIDSGHIVIHFDSTMLTLDSLALPPTWVIRDSTSGPGYLNIFITADSSQPLPNPIITLTFSTYLSSNSSAKVYLDSALLYGHRLNCDCSALSTDVDSVEVDFEGCADSLLLAVMNGGQIVFNIQSIVPNPAADEVTVNLARPSGTTVSYELYDALGSQQSSGSIASNQTTLDVSSLPSGIYYLRFSSEGYVQTRSISIQR
jgi:photosystem II stability/assembly factor-like uncharacterized protein